MRYLLGKGEAHSQQQQQRSTCYYTTGSSANTQCLFNACLSLPPLFARLENS